MDIVEFSIDIFYVFCYNNIDLCGPRVRQCTLQHVYIYLNSQPYFFGYSFSTVFDLIQHLISILTTLIAAVIWS